MKFYLQTNEFYRSDSGKLDENQDLIQMPEGYKNVFIYSTIHYNILFIFTYFNNDTLQDLNVEPKWKVFGSILQNDSTQISDPFLIYQTSTSQFNLGFPNCDKFYNGSGFYCDLFFTQTLDSNVN